MNQEQAIAKGRLAELKLQAAEAEMAVSEERATLRELVGPLTVTKGLDDASFDRLVARIVFLSARLVKALQNLHGLEAEMSTLREEYNL